MGRAMQPQRFEDEEELELAAAPNIRRPRHQRRRDVVAEPRRWPSRLASAALAFIGGGELLYHRLNHTNVHVLKGIWVLHRVLLDFRMFPNDDASSQYTPRNGLAQREVVGDNP